MHSLSPRQSRSPSSPRSARWPAHLAAAVAAIAVALALTSCASAAPTPSPSTSAYRGSELKRPIVLSRAAQDAVFRSSAGGTQTLGKLQAGHLMLVYFGYTHCPDVCPTTMADLGQALRHVPTIVQANTQVVFVTADPDRDSPSVMHAWLANFDPGLSRRFIGLTAGVKQIDTVADSLGVPLEPPVKEKNGSITVTHGAQTLAFLHGRASVVWLAGTPVADYATDIATLVTQARAR